MQASLLTTKLYVPPIRAEWVSRPRLVERLNAGVGFKLTLVSAGAGFGKTTLIADWLSHLQCPYTWLTLDEGDNDPVRLLTYLVAALQKVDERIGRAFHGLLGVPQPPPIESVLACLINDLAGTPRRFVLVLDDYEAIHEAAAHGAVEFLVEHQPPELRLVIISRQDPPLPLPRLRVRGQLVEIREQDLRFAEDEAAQFLSRALAMDLAGIYTASLAARTEGWIAGLQLAALSLQGRTGERVAEFVEHFGGSHRHVIDYLADEVLAQQSEGVRSFLCQTSILDRLSAPLCDALTGRVDSREVLRYLEQANLFLIPLDDRREWYRYHRLFGDFLRTELDSETQALLHQKASRWLEAEHLLPEAVRHALASGDPDRTAGVISRSYPEALSLGALVTLQSWLDALPEELVRGDADLATAQGHLLFFAGRATEASLWAEAAERKLSADAPANSRGRLLSLNAHLALCRGDHDATLRFSREALACLDEAETLFRNLMWNAMGQVMEVKGDLVGAAGAYRQGLHSTRQVGAEVGGLVVLTNLVLALNELGRRREALVMCLKVSGTEEPELPHALPLAQGMYLAWSLLSYEANELELAREQATRALDLAEQANIADGVLWGRFILARVHLASGELDAARQMARDGRELATRLDVYKGKVQWFAAIEAEASMAQGDLDTAGRWAESTGYSSSDVPHPFDEFAYLTYVRILLALGRLDTAESLLDTMERSASKAQRCRKLITINLLRAVLDSASGRTHQAIARVAESLEIAAPEGYRRAFLDEGSAVVDLLQRVHNLAPEFVSQVLAAAAVEEEVRPIAADGTLVEPLTERESEILRLIAAGRSNPEIAELLYLSLNTVKWHVKNLFGKLGVSNRIEAVARAQELRLL